MSKVNKYCEQDKTENTSVVLSSCFYLLVFNTIYIPKLHQLYLRHHY